MRLAVGLAVLMVGRSWWSWSELRARMLPDFDLYTVGGLGLFPSPIGRALGSFGPDVFAAISSVSSGLIVLFVGLLARRRGYSCGWAALLVSLAPASLYLGYAGIDPIGLALLLAGLLWTPWLAVAAGATHLSLLPFALLRLPRAGYAAVLAPAVLVSIATAALLLTPYSGIVYGLVSPGFVVPFVTALGFGLLLSFPAVFFVGRPSWALVLPYLIGAAESGANSHVQARYMLPAVALTCAYARVPVRVSRLVRRAYTASYSWGAGVETPASVSGAVLSPTDTVAVICSLTTKTPPVAGLSSQTSAGIRPRRGQSQA